MQNKSFKQDMDIEEKNLSISCLIYLFCNGPFISQAKREKKIEVRHNFMGFGRNPAGF